MIKPSPLLVAEKQTMDEQHQVQDIAARLREHARACQSRADSISSGYKSMPWTERARDLREAADEIDRLRNQLADATRAAFEEAIQHAKSDDWPKVVYRGRLYATATGAATAYLAHAEWKEG